jgi:hypothetical protein
MQITFINHACVKISVGDATILCDPWLDGPAFNFGWDLLIKTPLDRDAVMQDVTHIWLSHEHPDHFAPKFFNEIAARYAPSVPVLFQRTRDRRVLSFLRSRGFTVIELPDRKPQTIAGLQVTCGVDDFYDSWLHVSDGRHSVLNLNDCNLADPAELRAIARLTGPLDLLFTQFSYAAWKGGRANAYLRARAADRKLAAVAAQTRTLRPRWVVPFASFIYFSNRENAYLNDSVNTPEAAREVIAAAGAQPMILFPGDHWTVDEPHDDGPARAAYRRLYASLSTLPLREPGDSVPLSRLEREFASYRDRVYAQNSPALIRLLRRIPALGVFRPLKIRLTDLDEVVSVSVVDGFRGLPKSPEDVSMHSSSLSFIFNNPFGFDTLAVNGRFEATPQGFGRMTKSLAIGSLNAMGLSVSPRLVLDAKIVLLLLHRLASVMHGMSRGLAQQRRVSKSNPTSADAAP